MNVKDKKSLKSWSPTTYKIEIEGELNEIWVDAFEGKKITTRKREDQSVVTCLTGPVLDQCELMGILNGLFELHLPILTVKNVDKDTYLK